METAEGRPMNTHESKDRTAALEELWAAVKDWRKQPLGYSPKIAQAVQCIDNLERNQKP
jgi:hypothetical protein